MTQDEIDREWSGLIGGSIADELIVGKVLAEADLERATAIAAQMLYIHLVSGDRPDSANRRYKDGL
jgi:ATP-dependent Zn protease